ncbi:MAG TPA: beta-ketoacyl-[acyl-carrier-protein] synthase family protein [Bryobacteraceae bacterium]|jgi:3-oxoacyl-[acyl-carrier-protein] synthase II|nr:beta-ketoacyl-[acyl-carrier-protein] synthase family protein [Bryobacteraceae bacterium]
MTHRVVITGIGAVSPNGIGRENFWQATRLGKSGVRRITRFDPAGFQVQIAGEVADFDETAQVEPKDRQHVSRCVPLGLAAAREAVADAGIDAPRMTRDELRKIGVLVGSGGGSQEFTEQQYRLYYSGKEKQCSVYTIPTSTIGTLASEISMRFGFRGLSHLISTGCTSSTDAIGYAFRQIQYGTLPWMLVGGVDAPIAPLILRGFMVMRILTSNWNKEPERGSRPFSRDRSGFVLGEGAWFFVMEDYEHARARGAHIYGEIAGYASTCEAYHRVRLEECGEEPARTMEMAMEEAAISPEAVGYINYHGTSTELNDRIETRATRLAFNGHAYRLAGSSLKSLIGHPQGACGAAGVAAILLGMRDGVVPPTINLEDPDPECDLDYVPGKARALDCEYALANCIAFGSKNSALVLKKL